jgi:Txe/YoeB family toxin of Txe-Axe toxin-antitoxin module
MKWAEHVAGRLPYFASKISGEQATWTTRHRWKDLKYILRETERGYMESKINELVTHYKQEYSYRGINEFKKCSQPITNLVKDVESDMFRFPEHFEQMQRTRLSVTECTWG